MQKDNNYTVWRRSPDGYVDGTAYGVGGSNHGQMAGVPVTFEVLLVTKDWFGEAVPLIEAERNKPGYANPEKNWNKE